MTAARFEHRHIGPTAAEEAEMLAELKLGSIDQLIAECIPADILPAQALPEWAARSEAGMLADLRAIAGRNRLHTSLIGQGYHGTVVPPVIQRNLLENPAWYTAYTPYQPEISQGRLESLINFQTLVCELTGLDIANASLLDEASAAAEAMALCRRASKVKSNRFFVDGNTHPQTLDVLRTRAEPLGWQIVTGDPATDIGEAFGVLLSYPGSDGAVRDWRTAIAKAHADGALVAMAADPMALVLLTPPGELGADIAFGSMQRFGVPMGYGGPHAAYMAVKDALKRDLPGRIVGISLDAGGRRALRLALQTREQHIRREKATSNICTAQVLLANMAAMYAVWHGPDGLTAIARDIHGKAQTLAAGLAAAGVEIMTPAYFDTLTVKTGGRQAGIIAAAAKHEINFRVYPDGERIGIALDETTTDETVGRVLSIFGAGAALSAPDGEGIPLSLRRASPPVRHGIFGAFRSETAMMRYLRKLADRDLALDRAMIPLGSCTMKLNAVAEMMPVSWPEFAAPHPFAPGDQAGGYHELASRLEGWLIDISGYDAVSLQPNSGAQGEFAGLMAIRGYHAARGDGHRKICLIPSSAHGTNPASAHMAGMEVVVVACDSAGNVDLADLDAKAARHGDRLAALMVTYPSTHGVFEAGIRRICDIVHAQGGMVYLDGANMNAQVGLTRPGDYGADVSHLNLHKTFAIPHGGGGPGMGPIGVKAHLAPFLPGSAACPAVSAAPFGSASILPISYAYIAMMGSAGLKHASGIAILSANYIASKLDPYFPVLYKNENGRVAHECIIDPRALKASSGVTVDDIAKRLIDYGFHAPTMSFPVPGTLMIEPTESEPKAELDRFIAAMIAIRQEIAAIEAGEQKIEESALRHAPHTAEDLLADEWNRPYSRQAAAFPAGTGQGDKYWPPVSRVDNVHGDRHLICTCPPLESDLDISSGQAR